MDDQPDETRAEKTLRLIEAFDQLLRTCDEERLERSAAAREAEGQVLRASDVYLRWLQDELLRAAGELAPPAATGEGQGNRHRPARTRPHETPGTPRHPAPPGGPLSPLPATPPATRGDAMENTCKRREEPPPDHHRT
jgi:hypothetical protein